MKNLNVAEDDDFGKDANEDSGDLVSGLYCKIVVQFEKYRDSHDALKVVCGRNQTQGYLLERDKYRDPWASTQPYKTGLCDHKTQRRVTWYPQGQQIIAEVKLPHVRPTTLATVQIMCAQGDSRLDFHISSGSLIVLSNFLFLILSFGSLVCQY
ncbi:hypothetical protein HKD37_17G048980 [Glycine soja]